MKKRKFIALGIIIFGLLIFLVNVFSARSSDASPFLTIQKNSDVNPSLDFQAVTNGTQTSGDAPKGIVSDASNMTDALARSYLQKIFDKNPNGIADGSSSQITLPSLDLGQTSDQNAIDQALTFRAFTPKDLLVSQDNSNQAQLTYIENIDAALQKDFDKKFSKNYTALNVLDDFINNKDPKPLNSLVNSIPNFVNDLLQMRIPSSWQNYHLETLNLWQQKLVAYQNILNMDADPLRAYLTIQGITNLFQKDLDLQKIAFEKYQELKS